MFAQLQQHKAVVSSIKELKKRKCGGNFLRKFVEYCGNFRINKFG